MIKPRTYKVFYVKIKINLRENGIISSFDNWESILARVNFKKVLDNKKHELQDVIGDYVSESKLNCGLSSCNTPHNKGFIVITTDGLETNIGKDCGSKYFGISFDEKSKTHNTEKRYFDNKIKFANYLEQIPLWKRQIEVLSNGDFSYTNIANKISELFDKNIVGDIVVSCIINIHRIASNGQIYFEKPVTREDKVLMSRNLKVKPIYLGKLSYYYVLKKEINLSDLLNTDVIQIISKFENIKNLNDKEIAKILPKLNNIQSNINKAKDIITDAQKFLTRDNLQPLLKRIEEEIQYNKKLYAQHRLFKQFLTTLAY